MIGDGVELIRGSRLSNQAAALDSDVVRPLSITGITTCEGNEIVAVREIILPSSRCSRKHEGIQALIGLGIALAARNPAVPAIATGTGIAAPVIFLITIRDSGRGGLEVDGNGGAAA